MGNQLKICTLPNCQQVKNIGQIEFIPRFKNIQQIEQQISEYSKKHRLMFYMTHQRTLIQTLLALRQRHICEKLVQFTDKRQQQNKKILISDLLKVDFQKMDQLFFGSFQTSNQLFECKQFESKGTIIPVHQSKSTISPNIQSFNEFPQIVGSLHSKSAVLERGENQLQSKEKEKTRAQMSQNRQKQKLKFVQKLSSNNYDEYMRVGEKSIRLKQIIVLACIQCFNGIGASSPCQLPTKKSPLQILLDKMQAINYKYHETVLENSFTHQQSSECSNSNASSAKNNNSTDLILLVNARYLEAVTQLCANKYPILNSKIHIIKYESLLPSFDRGGKIILLQDNDSKKSPARLDFSTSNGDLIDFINRNMYIAELLQKHRFVHWVDPMNLLDKVCDPFSIGCLKRSKQFQGQRSRIVAKCIEIQQNNHADIQLLVSLNGFIENQYIGQQHDSLATMALGSNGSLTTHNSSQEAPKKQNAHKKIQIKRFQSSNKLISQKNRLSLLKSVILSTNLLINRTKYQDRLFLTRIRKAIHQNQSSNQSKHKYLFKRSIEDILQQKNTKLVYVQKTLEYAQIRKNDIRGNIISLNLIKSRKVSDAIIAYSNYCKHFLNIQNGNNLQLVQVCPQILFGAKDRQKKVIESFRSYNKVGFPLIIKKSEIKSDGQNN